MADTAEFSNEAKDAISGGRLVADTWFLADGLLGKGGFGFVKKGFHKENGRAFALKFIRKSEDTDSRSAKLQASQIATEINCLIKCNHPNILKLYAYRASCEYPEKDGGSLSTIMMVLELAQGGDLFDILFYTKSLPTDITRTYFAQLCNGMKAMHDAGIVHRDLKPQNLLLNKHFQLKITDFGLSKIFEGEDVQVMTTYYAGTQGYQAPEQLLKRKFTKKVDIFAAGVILFVLSFGYPPFQEGQSSDNWYKYIAAKKPERFWKKHRKQDADASFKDLVANTLTYQPKDRFDCDAVLAHPWVAEGEILSKKDLRNKMRNRYESAVEAKKNDANKQEILAHSNTGPSRAFDADPNRVIPVSSEPLNFLQTFQVKQGVEPLDFMNAIDKVFNYLQGSATLNNAYEVEGHITADLDCEDGETRTITAGFLGKLLRRSESSPVLFNAKMESKLDKPSKKLAQQLFDSIMGQVLDLCEETVEEFAYQEDDDLLEDEHEDMAGFFDEFNAQNPGAQEESVESQDTVA